MENIPPPNYKTKEIKKVRFNPLVKIHYIGNSKEETEYRRDRTWILCAMRSAFFKQRVASFNNKYKAILLSRGIVPNGF